MADAILDAIIDELKREHRCHTIILYGSRARGQTTSTSDYDVVGIRRAGAKIRIAKKQHKYYWDVFVYPEKDLRKLGLQHLSWKHARILYERGTYARQLLRRIDKLLKIPFKPEPQYEIDVTKIWAQKEFDRCKVKSIHGFYRRAEFQNALIDHYFMVRKKRFWGPKEGFAWMEEHDAKTFKLVHKALKNPKNLSALKAAASRVYKIALK